MTDHAPVQGEHYKKHKKEKRARNRTTHIPWGGIAPRVKTLKNVYGKAKGVSSEFKIRNVTVAQAAWTGSHKEFVHDTSEKLSLEEALNMKDRLALLKWDGVYVYFTKQQCLYALMYMIYRWYLGRPYR